MATVASFTLTSGTYTSSSGPKYYGFASDETTYNDQIGAINGGTGEYSVPVAWYPNTTIWSLTWLDYYNDLINLRLKGSSGIPANSGWESMSVTGAIGTYNRVDASYTSQPATSTAAWVWASTFNPFFSGNYLVTIDNGVADDTTPDQFSLGSDVSDVIRNSHTFRNFPVSGINSATTFTTNNSLTKVSLDNSTWTTSVSCTNGQQVYVRAQSASTYSTTTTHTVSAGGVSDSFTTTTEATLVLPDTSVSFSTSTPKFTGTFFLLTTSGASSYTTYRVRTTSYSGTIIKTFTGEVSFKSINNQPAVTGTTYYVTAYVSEANGGNSVEVNVGTFVASRHAEVLPDINVGISPAGNINIESSTFTKNITNANDNGVTLYLLRNDTDGTIESNGNSTSFPLAGVSPTTGTKNYRITAKVGTGSNGDGVERDVHTFSVTRVFNNAPIIGSFTASPTVSIGSQYVTLSGSGITDSDGAVSSITIVQTAGTTVSLSTPTITGLNTTNASITTGFTAPNADGTLVFRLTATDNDGASTIEDLIFDTVEEDVIAPSTGQGFQLFDQAGALTLDLVDVPLFFRGNISGSISTNYQEDVTIVVPFTGCTVEDLVFTNILNDYYYYSLSAGENQVTINVSAFGTPQFAVSYSVTILFRG